MSYESLEKVVEKAIKDVAYYPCSEEVKKDCKDKIMTEVANLVEEEFQNI